MNAQDVPPPRPLRLHGVLARHPTLTLHGVLSVRRGKGVGGAEPAADRAPSSSCADPIRAPPPAPSGSPTRQSRPCRMRFSSDPPRRRRPTIVSMFRFVRQNLIGISKPDTQIVRPALSLGLWDLWVETRCRRARRLLTQRSQRPRETTFSRCMGCSRGTGLRSVATSRLTAHGLMPADIAKSGRQDDR